MSESVENTNTTTPTPPTGSSSSYFSDLKSDGKSILNQAVWNMAIVSILYV